MVFLILIVIFCLIGLLVLHEFGHFIIAKKLGVKVEEFGIGYPPRIFGKRIGETIYSVNLLPFGAFVKIQGEEKKVEGGRSFSERPIRQRAAIISGGVISFWLAAFLIFSFIAGVWGLPTVVDDEFEGEAPVQIIQIAQNSPAEKAGIKPGDEIITVQTPRFRLQANKITEVQEFVAGHSGEEVTLSIKRGKEVLDIGLIPRTSPPEGEGAMGVALAKIANLKSPWYKAPVAGIETTAEKTVQIPLVFGSLLSRLIKGEKVEGVQLAGPIGISSMMGQALQAGVDNFLMFLAVIAIWLALFNLLPIPALDGGKLLFLLLEGVRKKPVSEVVEQKITAAFFLALLLLMVFVTIKDITRLF